MAKRKRALTRVEKLLRADGALCVSFVNAARSKPFASYEELLEWGAPVGALSAAEAALLADGAAADPAKAAGVFRRSRNLGERLGRMLEALAGGADPATADLRAFNFELRTALGGRELGPGGRDWTWREVAAEDLDRVLWPVAVSAADVLSSDARKLVRACALDGCGRLFLAGRAGRPRKWCSATCCNRYSSRRYYEKKIKPERAKRKRLKEGAQETALAGHDPERPLVKLGDLD